MTVQEFINEINYYEYSQEYLEFLKGAYDYKLQLICERTNRKNDTDDISQTNDNTKIGIGRKILMKILQIWDIINRFFNRIKSKILKFNGNYDESLETQINNVILDKEDCNKLLEFYDENIASKLKDISTTAELRIDNNIYFINHDIKMPINAYNIVSLALTPDTITLVDNKFTAQKKLIIIKNKYKLNTRFNKITLDELKVMNKMIDDVNHSSKIDIDVNVLFRDMITTQDLADHYQSLVNKILNHEYEYLHYMTPDDMLMFFDFSKRMLNTVSLMYDLLNAREKAIPLVKEIYSQYDIFDNKHKKND